MADQAKLMRELVGRFAVEAQDIGRKLTKSLLELEQATTPAQRTKLYDAAARALHTLKGSAATVALDSLADLAHRLEDVVVPLRRSGAPLPPETVDVLLRGLDELLTGVQAAAEGTPIQDLTEVLAAIRAASVAAERGPAADPSGASATPPPEGQDAPAREEPRAAAAAPQAAADARPHDGAREPAPLEDSWRVEMRQITALMREVERLRQLGQSLIERRRIVERSSSQLARDNPEVGALLGALRQSLVSDSEEATDIVDSLEDGVKAISTVPVQTVIDPLQRTVRDLCRHLGKEARLSVVGGEISLDRRLLEALKGPLIHLVRNAVDHGLETPAERERGGKHREGILVIRVEQLGNMIFLEISDDGRGIDTEQVRREVVRRNLVTPEELAALTPQQLHQFLFHAGFSTRREVTEISGRGVGLDVVLSQIQRLEGHVEVQSIQGQGTRFLLNFPAELGSSPLLVVRCGDHVLGMPLLAVESVTGANGKLRTGTNRLHLEYQEQLLPVKDLGALLALRQPVAPSASQPLLIVEARGKRVALLVDEILADQEAVIRPLPVELRGLPCYQGAAKLARGELLLILRSDWIVDQDVRIASARARRALVVDDSLTARALHRSVLEVAGYTVHTAADARQALLLLESSTYDVMVCDIGMEEIDGLALTAQLRARDETRALPIVLVSAHDTEEDRRRGLDAGADGFLSKKDCASGRLLSEVSAAIGSRARD